VRSLFFHGEGRGCWQGAALLTATRPDARVWLLSRPWNGATWISCRRLPLRRRVTATKVITALWFSHACCAQRIVMRPSSESSDSSLADCMAVHAACLCSEINCTNIQHRKQFKTFKRKSGSVTVISTLPKIYMIFRSLQTFIRPQRLAQGWVSIPCWQPMFFSTRCPYLKGEKKQHHCSSGWLQCAQSSSP
jgi:hypothetical protein